MNRRGEGGTGCTSGFTLIEVVGAVLLFSLALILAIQLSGSTGTQLERSAVTSEIVTMAQERLDSLQLLPFDSLAPVTSGDTLTVRGRRYARSWTVTQYSPILMELQVSLAPVDGVGPSFTAGSYRMGTWGES
ncbi:MAG: type II secretion system protein [Gemmatimonadota bacterium]